MFIHLDTVHLDTACAEAALAEKVVFICLLFTFAIKIKNGYRNNCSYFIGVSVLLHKQKTFKLPSR